MFKILVFVAFFAVVLAEWDPTNDETHQEYLLHLKSDIVEMKPQLKPADDLILVKKELVKSNTLGLKGGRHVEYLYYFSVSGHACGAHVTLSNVNTLKSLQCEKRR